MTDPLDVVVLAGGISHERDVSLRSARRLVDGLARLGWRVRTLEPDSRLLQALAEDPPDIVWPVLHGASGEDGALRSLLDGLGIRYVGARGDAARLAWDKPTAKRLAGAAGVATPASTALTREVFREIGAPAAIDALQTAFPGRVVVKPARGGSAQGVTVVSEVDQLPRALVDAFTYADEALVEQHVAGTEIAVGVIEGSDGPRALPAVEIVPTSGTYGYEERYTAGATRFYTPARIATEAAEAAGASALAVHAALGMRHLSRVDLIVDEAGTPWFLEVNAMPGLTETSLLPQALISTGDDLSAAYAALTRLAAGA